MGPTTGFGQASSPRLKMLSNEPNSRAMYTGISQDPSSEGGHTSTSMGPSSNTSTMHQKNSAIGAKTINISPVKKFKNSVTEYCEKFNRSPI